MHTFSAHNSKRPFRFLIPGILFAHGFSDSLPSSCRGVFFLSCFVFFRRNILDLEDPTIFPPPKKRILQNKNGDGVAGVHRTRVPNVRAYLKKTAWILDAYQIWGYMLEPARMNTRVLLLMPPAQWSEVKTSVVAAGGRCTVPGTRYQDALGLGTGSRPPPVDIMLTPFTISILDSISTLVVAQVHHKNTLLFNVSRTLLPLGDRVVSSHQQPKHYKAQDSPPLSLSSRSSFWWVSVI